MEVRELASALGLHEQIAALLCARGVDTVDAAQAFLYPKTQDMAPAMNLANMAAAKERILAAIAAKERILIFGDYDCDGISATAILTLYLQSVGADVRYHIPRRADGYGLSEQAVEQVVGEHLPDLLITVDCGVTSVAEVEYAMDLGVDVIVTDHHEPQDELPDCIVVNPKLGDDPRLHDICGAAVAMKVVEALAGKEVADAYLDLAALATVADVVPLVGENRIIVSHGLKLLSNSTRKGLRALVKSCTEQQVTSSDIGFRIGPRINALGRMGEDVDVVELFLTDDDFVVRQLVEKITAANTARQALTRQLVAQAYKQLADYDLTNYRAIVLWDEHWEAGVLGLVAGRLAQEFYRPVVLLTSTGDSYKGSARSVPGVNIFAALKAVEHRLLGYGGHMGAAGMSVKPDNLKAFRDELNEYICKTYQDDVFVYRPHADLTYMPDAMHSEFFEQLARLEPFGEGNPTPRFAVAGEGYRMTRIGDGEHIKCAINREVEMVYFGGAYMLSAAHAGLDYTYYCEAGKNVYQNRVTVQMRVVEAGVTGCEHMRDSAPAFGGYLKTVLYPPKQVGTRTSNLQKEVSALSGMYGTLFVAFGVDSARAFLKELTLAGKRNLLGRVVATRTEQNPLHTLLIAPTDCTNWQYYSSIVFLDAPLSMGYLGMVGQAAPNPELVLLPNYAFIKQIKALNLSVEDIAGTLRGITRLEHPRNLDDMCMQLQARGHSVADIYAHFYILFELGLVKVGQGFRLTCLAGAINPDQSRVYKNLMKLRERE